MSTIIKLRCIDQVLTFESTPVIASGGLGEDVLSIEFCSKWDGLAKTAVFWLPESEGTAYHVPLGLEDSCTIPWEVLEREGVFYFGVFGVSEDGRQRTTEAVRYTVAQGVLTSGTTPADPTPDLYNQLLARYAEVVVKTEAVLADAEQVARAAENAFLAADAAAEDAAAAQGAANAAANAAAAAARHTHTAADVGARPDTWMPTAAQVGARPDTWMPTAAQVGARPDTWTPTAEEVGLWEEAEDLYAITKTAIVKYTESTKNTPYSQGLTQYATGLCHVVTSASYRALFCVTGAGQIFTNFYYSGWKGWRRFYSEANKPSAADAGALALDGSNAMTGNLKLEKSNPMLLLAHTSGFGGAAQAFDNMLTLFSFTDVKKMVNANYRRLDVNNQAAYTNLKNAIRLRDYTDGVMTSYDVLHAGNLSENGVPRIEVGSYKGTGTNGVTLTFSGTPKFVYVALDRAFWTCPSDAMPYGMLRFFWVPGMVKEVGTIVSGGSSNDRVFTQTENSLTWTMLEPIGTPTTDDMARLNISGNTYNYFAVVI